jgi:hypothetical protein
LPTFILAVFGGIATVAFWLVNMTLSLFGWAFALTFAAWLFPETFKQWLALFHVAEMQPWQVGVGFGLVSWMIRAGGK